MKHLLLIVLIAPLFSLCQDTTSRKKPSTKLEELSRSEGSVVKKEFYNLGTLRGVEVKFLVITDVTKGVTAKGISFYQSSVAMYSRSSHTAFLDADEISGLEKFIDFVKELKEKPNVYTEFNYRSRGDFKMFAYAEKNSDWSTGLYVDADFSGSDITIKEKEIEALTTMINNAKSKL